MTIWITGACIYVAIVVLLLGFFRVGGAWDDLDEHPVEPSKVRCKN